MSEQNTSKTQNIGDVPETDDLRKTIDLSKLMADGFSDADEAETAKAGEAEVTDAEAEAEEAVYENA